MPYMQTSASYEKRLLLLQCTLMDAGIGICTRKQNVNIGTARCGLQEGHTSHCLES